MLKERKNQAFCQREGGLPPAGLLWGTMRGQRLQKRSEQDFIALDMR